MVNGWMRGMALPGMVIAAVAVGAATARADIVYDEGQSQITLANDDGSNARPLVTAAQIPGIKGVFAPAVSPHGTTVVFEGEDPTFDPRGLADCGSDCAGVYQDVGGTVTRVSGHAPPCSDPCELLEQQPEISPTGRIIAQYDWATWVSFMGPDAIPIWSINADHSWTGLTAPPHGDPVDGPSANEVASLCSSHNVAIQPQMPTFSPDGSKLAYVNCKDSSSPARYLLGVENADGSNAVACASDDQALQDPSFALDGATILDGEAGDNPGLWRHPAGCGAGATYVLAAPANINFFSPRETAAGRILFVAVQPNGSGGTTGDVWAVAASCGAGGTPCQFPADATQITHVGDVTNVGWTAATITPSSPSAPGGSPPPSGSTSSGSPPPAGTAPGTAGPTALVSALRMVRTHLRAIARGLRVTFACRAACSGTVTVGVSATTARHLHLGRHAVTLGRATFRLASGTHATVRVAIARRYRGRLRRQRRVTFVVTARPRGGAARRTTVVVRR